MTTQIENTGASNDASPDSSFSDGIKLLLKDFDGHSPMVFSQLINAVEDNEFFAYVTAVGENPRPRFLAHLLE